ncbi:MAG: hypothetical protein CL609_23315 [Anaerolineaceae bacterium]|nr:hypothetical protein [Anaerolineaceae bacterium]
MPVEYRQLPALISAPPDGRRLLLTDDLGKEFSEDHEEIFFITTSGEQSQGLIFLITTKKMTLDYSFATR